jgi:hypothetical protein
MGMVRVSKFRILAKCLYLIPDEANSCDGVSIDSVLVYGEYGSDGRERPCGDVEDVCVGGDGLGAPLASRSQVPRQR